MSHPNPYLSDGVFSLIPLVTPTLSSGDSDSSHEPTVIDTTTAKQTSDIDENKEPLDDFLGGTCKKKKKCITDPASVDNDVNLRP
eukprot:3216332-Ditylum_brightwellii.AAC.1